MRSQALALPRHRLPHGANKLLFFLEIARASRSGRLAGMQLA
jgi:hypothetical protein